jgi:SAM-dependent methyltransferase
VAPGPYDKSAEVYDAIYSKWDYAKDARLLRRLIRKHSRSGGRDLLDVACGTGKHLELLRRWFTIEGLDVSAQMLRVARRRLRGVRLTRESFLMFFLRRKFDVILCMGSAIGYARTLAGLRRTLRAMASHLKPGGALFVVPWVLRPEWKQGHVHVDVRGEGRAQIARMGLSGRRGDVSVVDMHHLVAGPAGIRHYEERHELGLWTVEEHLKAAAAAGLEARFIPKGKDWFRGLLVGVKPLSSPSSRARSPSARAGRPSRPGRGREASRT